MSNFAGLGLYSNDNNYLTLQRQLLKSD